MQVVAPRYGEASLADLLPATLAALGVAGMPDPLGLAVGPLAGVRRVAVLLIDGLGHEQLPAAGLVAPTLADLAAGRLGVAAELTAGFPSTTPTSLVTFGTGAPPGAHGIVGFTLRVPGTDRILNHLDWTDDPDPASWQPVSTLFDRSAAAGVPVTVVSRPEYVGTGLTTAAWGSAQYRPGTGVDELASGMLDALVRYSGRTLVYGYHPEVDKAGHLFGVDSAQWRAEVAEVDRLLTRLLDGLPADAALVVTADHGQLDIPADKRIDLDADPRLGQGVVLRAGEPRVRYLHTVPGARDDVLATWRAVLGDAAWVATREEAVAAGWFGPVAPDHLARIGDVVAACHDRYALLARRTEPERVSTMVAFHGSYTSAEMRIPLLIARSVGPSG